MSMGGSKTQTTEIPQFIEDALRQNIDRGETMSRIGYKPYYGPTVAGMNELQKGAMRNTSALARGLGMGGAMWNDARQGGIRPTQDFGNGMQGYSSGDMFDQALAELQRRRPGQYQAYADMFIDPQSGAPAQYDLNRAAAELVRGGMAPEIASAVVSGGDGLPAWDGTGTDPYMAARRLSERFRDNNYPWYAPGGILANAVEYLTNMGIDAYEALPAFLGERRVDGLGDGTNAGISRGYYDYQTDRGSNSSWNPTRTSGPDISYSEARDRSDTTGYNFNRD